MLPDTWQGSQRPRPIRPSAQTATARAPGEPQAPGFHPAVRAGQRENPMYRRPKARQFGGFGYCDAQVRMETSPAWRRPTRRLAPSFDPPPRLDRQRSAHRRADWVRRCPLATSGGLGELRRCARMSPGELVAGSDTPPAGDKIWIPRRCAMVWPRSRRGSGTCRHRTMR